MAGLQALREELMEMVNMLGPGGKAEATMQLPICAGFPFIKGAVLDLAVPHLEILELSFVVPQGDNAVDIRRNHTCTHALAQVPKGWHAECNAEFAAVPNLAFLQDPSHDATSECCSHLTVDS